MKATKVYEYQTGKGFRRFTITAQARDEMEGTYFQFGSEEIRELYKSGNQNDRVFVNIYGPSTCDCEGRPELVYVERVVVSVVSFFVEHYLELKEKTAQKVGLVWYSKMQKSLCGGIAGMLGDMGFTTKVVKVTTECNALKTWHMVVCKTSIASGRELKFGIMPMSDVFIRKDVSPAYIYSSKVLYFYGEDLKEVTPKFTHVVTPYL